MTHKIGLWAQAVPRKEELIVQKNLKRYISHSTPGKESYGALKPKYRIKFAPKRASIDKRRPRTADQQIRLLEDEMKSAWLHRREIENKEREVQKTGNFIFSNLNTPKFWHHERYRTAYVLGKNSTCVIVILCSQYYATSSIEPFSENFLRIFS